MPLPDAFRRHDVAVTLPADTAADLFRFLYGCVYRPTEPRSPTTRATATSPPVRPTPPDHTLADCYPCDREGNLDPGFSTSGNRRSAPANPVRHEDLGEPVALLPYVLDP